ncbi:MAG TPA: hypothetical protein VMT63_09265 [Bacteroidales bacterium]|nr:hypothetical protein [Bacteroidales bacterium]
MKSQESAPKRSITGNVILVSVLLHLAAGSLAGQTNVRFYTEAGEYNVSRGMYIRSAVIPGLAIKRNLIEAGLETNVYFPSKPAISGFSLRTSKIFTGEKTKFSIELFWITNFSSTLLSEKMWGADCKMSRNHFEMTLGINFDWYSFNRKAEKLYSIDRDAATVHETFNALYSFTYRFRGIDSKWNLGLTITDYDYFGINQETNPILRIGFNYKVSRHLNLVAEGNYLCAGITNFAFGYFGFNLKTGVIWNF